MPEDDFKNKMRSVIKKYKMDGKLVTKALNKFGPKLNLEQADKEITILRIVTNAGEKGLEVETGFRLMKMEIGFDLDPGEILERFEKTIKKKLFQDIESKMKRERLAANTVKSQIAEEVRVQTKMFDIVVLGKSSPKPITTKAGDDRIIANLAAFCTPIEDDSIEPFYRSLTFWGEDGAKINQVIIGHRYHCNLVKDRSADGLDAWKPADKTEFISKGKFDGEISDILEKINVPKIDISEAEFHISTNPDDYKRIDCEIMGHQILTRGDNEVGMMFVVDESSEDMIYGGDGEDDPSGGFTLFADPQNLMYGDGSEISVIGRVRQNKDEKISMSVDAIIPVLVLTIDGDDEDEVDMRTGDGSVIDLDTLAALEGGEDEDPLVDDDDDD